MARGPESGKGAQICFSWKVSNEVYESYIRCLGEIYTTAEVNAFLNN